MTFKEFIEFIGKDSNHFIGFLLVIGILSEFIIRIIYIIFMKNKE